MDCLLRIKELLNERKWSMYQLSQRSNIPQSTLSNLFLRNNAPTLPTLEKICEALGMTLAEFFGSAPDLPDEEADVIREWRLLAPQKQYLIIELMRAFNNNEK